LAGCSQTGRLAFAQRRPFLLEVGLTPQGVIPAPLQFRGHQTVLRIDGIVLTPGPPVSNRLCSGPVSRWAIRFVTDLGVTLERRQGRAQTQGLQAPQDFVDDPPISVEPAEGDAVASAVVHEGTRQ